MKRRLGEIIIVIGVAIVFIAMLIDLATGPKFDNPHNPNIPPIPGVQR